MIKKLIPIDPETGRYTQVDTKRLMRETRALLNFIDVHIKPENDEFKILKYVRPMCEAVLSGKTKLPFPYSELPLKYYIREGMLPRDLSEVYSEFAVTVSGSPRTFSERINIDGILHKYADFEE